MGTIPAFASVAETGEDSPTATASVLDFLQRYPAVAQLLQEAEDPLRTAFGVARNHARDNERLTLQRTGRDHQRILLHYRRRPDRTHQEIAELLFRLWRQRNQADYDDQMSATVTGAHTALRRARQVLAGLETLQT